MAHMDVGPYSHGGYTLGAHITILSARARAITRCTSLGDAGETLCVNGSKKAIGASARALRALNAYV